ncbi:aldo/keto reductase [candidate division KSB1 bacterium]
MKSTRRDFLKKGVISAAGAALLPSSCKPSKEELIALAGGNKIISRNLGKTGIKVPVVSMGVDDNIDIVPSAIELGLTYFQTSSNYRNGQNERDLGRIVKVKGRDNFILGTGFSLGKYIYKENLRIDNNFKKENLIRSFESALKRLKMEYIDIYFLFEHYSKDTLMHEPIIESVINFKKSGKARSIGAAAHSNVPAVIREAADSGIYDVVMVSRNFRNNDADEIDRAINYAAGKGLGIIAMKTQAGVYWDRKRESMINMKAALKWALQNENVHTAVTLYNNTRELAEGVSVMNDLKLTDSEKRDLKLPVEGSGFGLYCQQCGECTGQCGRFPEIPAVMRCYMYAYGYRSLYKAKHTFSSLNLKQIPCEDCERCTVKCTMGFDIRRKVLDISRIKDIPGEFLT